MIASSLFMLFISTDWVHLHGLLAALALISFAIFCILPESPKYLVQREEYDRAFAAYNTIAKFNGTPELQLSRPAGHRFHEERPEDKKFLRHHMRRAKAQAQARRPIGLGLAASIVDEDEREYISSSESGEDDDREERMAGRRGGVGFARRKTSSVHSAERVPQGDLSIEYLMVQSDNNSEKQQNKHDDSFEKLDASPKAAAEDVDGDDFTRQKRSSGSSKDKPSVAQRSDAGRSQGGLTSMWTDGMADNKYTIAELCQDKIYRANLIIMVISWSSSSFCFYILGFYIKYIPGDIFINIIITCVADAISSIGAVVIAQTIGTQRTLFASYGLAAIGGVLLILFDKNDVVIMILMMVTKFGINVCFTLCYIINAEYFPSIVCARVFGICNIFSRISTILSPLIAEVTPPIPMIIYVLICTISMVASMFLTKAEDGEAFADLDDCMSQ